MKRKIKKNNSYRGQVRDLNSDGAGVVKVDGYTFFVQGALPGEDISFKVVKIKKNFAYGKLEEIHTRSEYRIDLAEDAWTKEQVMPLSHLSYDKQLEYKQNEVYQAFKRIGKFEDFDLKEIIGMDKPHHYRNKAQLPVQEVDGKLETGIFRRRSHDLIPLEDSYISNEEIDKIAIRVRGIIDKYGLDAYDESKGTGDIRHIIIKRGHYSKEVMIILVTNKKKIKDLDNIVMDISKINENIVSIIQNIQDKNTNVILGNESKVLWGQDYYSDQMLGLDFHISEKSFYQVNTIQAEKLYEKAIEIAGLTKNDTVLDAYCGIGTITLNLARQVKEAYGVEIVGQAIEMARKNAKLNGIENSNFIAGKSEEVIVDLKKAGIDFDAVFVDPPRKGLDKKFIETIINMDIPKFIYISCKPSTQARDCKILKDGGYKLKYIQPVDMFPQTTHCEVVSLLTKM